jgi:uncharacterized protein (UPF0332 family)
MTDLPDYRGLAEHKLAHAQRAVDAGLYESASIAVYLAALHAAREIVFKKTLVRPKKPDAVRRRLTTLVWQGLEFDPKLLRTLKDGRRTMLRLDYGLRVAHIPHEKALDAVVRAREFLNSARAICD